MVRPASGKRPMRWDRRPVESTASPMRVAVTNRMRMWRRLNSPGGTACQATPLPLPLGRQRCPARTKASSTMAQGNFVVLDDRGVLAVSGADRSGFLQGLVSNDVEKIAADRAVYAALLTAQGKYLHDFIMVEHGDSIWLDAEAARIADLKRRLSMYRLRAKVEIAERPELAVAAAFGGGALTALDLPDQPGAARPLDGGVALVDPRLSELGARIVADRGRLARLAAEF